MQKLIFQYIYTVLINCFSLYSEFMDISLSGDGQLRFDTEEILDEAELEQLEELIVNKHKNHNIINLWIFDKNLRCLFPKNPKDALDENNSWITNYLISLQIYGYFIDKLIDKKTR